MENGYTEVSLSSWRWFGDFINQELLDYRNYVFRGHASDKWKLESTLDRALRRIPEKRREHARRSHLSNFMLAARGRRGPNPPRLTDDEWFALGQHYGLATPLLDWTESPFVALYFAFLEADTDGASHRAVWALTEGTIKEVASVPEFRDARFVRPFSDENARLVSQRGLFVRCPPATQLENAVRKAFDADGQLRALVKFRIPRPHKDRAVCLRNLNRMNINHLSLFPDLAGASLHCNQDLAIEAY